MAQCMSPLDTAHRGPIHAAQLDHFGKRLATASADRSVRVWDVESRHQHQVAELHGHDGPVWIVSWSHPMFGPLLASAGEDKFMLMWREGDTEWCQIYKHELPGSAMSASFSPWEYGLQFALAASSGDVLVLSCCSGNGNSDLVTEDQWGVESFKAHEGGTYALCWASATSAAILVGTEEMAARRMSLEPRRLVTGGADHQVRIWRYDEHTHAWADQHHFPAGEHCHWVRDVAWRPNCGIPTNTIASCAEDGTVVIWSQPMVGQPWRKRVKWILDASAWQLSWSPTGSILTVSTSSNKVLLYKEALDGQFQPVECDDVIAGDLPSSARP